MVSSGTRSRSAGERVRLFSATWAGVKSRQAPPYSSSPSEAWGALAAWSWARLQKQG